MALIRAVRGRTAKIWSGSLHDGFVEDTKANGWRTMWLVYDKFKARLWMAERNELPKSVVALFEITLRRILVRGLCNTSTMLDGIKTKIFGIRYVTPVTRDSSGSSIKPFMAVSGSDHPDNAERNLQT